MTKIIFTIILSLIALALSKSVDSRMSDTMTNSSMMATTISMYQDRSIDNSSDLDVLEIMSACNDSFRIEMANLEALNETGSFIDESDKTAKCFIRCVLENMGILSEDGLQFNPARAAVIFAGERNGKPINDIGDMTALCAVRQESCPCDRSYKFLRCLMTMEIEEYEKS